MRGEHRSRGRATATVRTATRFPVETTLLVVVALAGVATSGWLLAGAVTATMEAVASHRQHIMAVLLLAGVAACWWGIRRLRRRFGRPQVPHHCPRLPTPLARGVRR